MMLGLVCAGWMAAIPSAEPRGPADVARAYQEARAGAGRAPGDQVRLALWCEAHGLTAERLHHLGLAVIANPRDAAARGLMGLVSYEDRWRRPEVVAETARADAALTARLADYNARRARTPDTADAQWRLALWCEEAGLKSEATAHLSAVVRLDPSHENAWKRLGCKKYEGRWLNDNAISLEKADEAAQKVADRKWKPLLEKYREALRGPNSARRADAEKALDELTDPRAVDLVWSTFAMAGSWGQPIAVRALGQIDAPAASRFLAVLAVFGQTPEIRRTATETLKGRDPREFASLLIGLLRDEIKYEVRPVNGPGSPGVLYVKGEQFDVRRVYSPPAVPSQLIFMAQRAQLDSSGMPVIRWVSDVQVSQPIRVYEAGLMNYRDFMAFRPSDPEDEPSVRRAQQDAPRQLSGFLWTHPNNHTVALWDRHYLDHNYYFLRVAKTQAMVESDQTRTTIPVGRMIAEYEKSAAAAQAQLDRDRAAIVRQNDEVKGSNEGVLRILRVVSGLDLGADRERWKGWYIDLKGYAYNPPPGPTRPVVVQDVALDYSPQDVPIDRVTKTAQFAVGPAVWSTTPYSTIPSCFGAGTPVRTLTGPRAIETLRVGDRVLTQSTANGTLGYRPIVGVHHNPPSPTFLIRLAGDTIVSSPFHRFWKAGRGWVMAREIRAGDRLRLLEGVAEVEAVEAGPVQLVYNLDVAEDADFFAGNAAALVHDNTLPDPRLAPFDAPKAPGPALARVGN